MIKFWVSAETFKDASPYVEELEKLIENTVIHRILNYKEIEHINFEVRYIPIIMPPELAIKYPERSQSKIKQKLYNCCPILNYHNIIDISCKIRTREYLGGLSIPNSFFHRIGLSENEINLVEPIFQCI